MNNVPELNSIVDALKRNSFQVWDKVSVLGGANIHVICCCNSEQCQRIKVVWKGNPPVKMKRMGRSGPGEMPGEIEDILDVCVTSDELGKQVAAYNRSRFDLIFTCRGRALQEWGIGDS